MAIARTEWVGGSRGFSLLEVLVATTIMVVGVAALAQLFVMATRANHRARTTTFAAVLAQQKMEQLRGLTWGFDAIGLPLSDPTTDLRPAELGRRHGTRAARPGDAQQNTSGYCDFVDANGQSLGGGATPPAGTAFVRRWSIEPLPTNPNNTIVIQVRSSSEVPVPAASANTWNEESLGVCRDEIARTLHHGVSGTRGDSFRGFCAMVRGHTASLWSRS